MSGPLARVPAGDVAAALARSAGVLGLPAVEVGPEGARLTFTFAGAEQGGTDAALQAVELLHDLRYLVDMAQLRAIAAHYDIDADALAASAGRRDRG